MKLKYKKYYKIIIPFVLVFAILLPIMPRIARFQYDYKKGTIWKYETLIADFSFPILKTQEQLSKEKSVKQTKIPYYKYSEDIVNETLRSAERMTLPSSVARYRSSIVGALRVIYSKGIIAEDDQNMDNARKLVFIQKSKKGRKYPISDIYKESEAKIKLLFLVEQQLNKTGLDTLFRDNNIYSLIRPNLLYDSDLSQSYYNETSEKISPTLGYVAAGKVLVSKGDLITAETVQILDSYKIEFENSLSHSGSKKGYTLSLLGFWLGNIILALALVILLAFAIYYTYPRIFKEINSLIYILILFLLFTIIILVLEKINYKLLYIVPFTLPALYMQAFFKRRLILPICIITLLPLLIFAHDGMVLFVTFMVAQVISIYVFPYFSRGWKQFLYSGFIFISVLLTYLAFWLVDLVHGSLGLNILYLFIGSFLTVAAYPLIYLFERMFNLLSNTRLMELCDTNNFLLRELERIAPGTFQHSLQVMRMADTVARAIGANALLIRAGALYHDIGKMANPLCFIENESLAEIGTGESYHKDLSAKDSAKDIIKHVADGLELAEKYRLPYPVREFIVTHHGTSFTGYFYNKYINEGGDPNNKEDFTYPGKSPRTREHMILMLCDSIEAASRTLKTHNLEAYDEFVENIVASKMKAGQFEENEISIKDLNMAKSVIKSYLAQIYHERVVYPKAKRKIQ